MSLSLSISIANTDVALKAELDIIFDEKFSFPSFS